MRKKIFFNGIMYEMFSGAVLELGKYSAKPVLEIISISVIAAHIVSSNPVPCDLLLNMLNLLSVPVIRFLLKAI